MDESGEFMKIKIILLWVGWCLFGTPVFVAATASESPYASPYDEQHQIDFFSKDIDAVPAATVLPIQDVEEHIYGPPLLQTLSEAQTNEFPYRAGAYLEIAYDNGKVGGGSATFVSENVLVTAAHNIYKHQDRALAEHIKVIPAAHQDAMPFGVHIAKYVLFPGYLEAHAEGEERQRKDFAVLILDTPVGKKTGSLGMSASATQSQVNQLATISGYSGYGPAHRVMSTNTKYILEDRDELLLYQINTLTGASGAAVYNEQYQILGVHNTGRGTLQRNIAAKMTEEKQLFVKQHIKQNQLTGWKKHAGFWYFYQDTMERAVGWIEDQGRRYYLNESGMMQTGWIQLDNVWYYLHEGGEIAIGWVRLRNDWYYVDAKGVMQVGWQKINGKWYYLHEGGQMATRWVRVADQWYYLDETGAMQTGWLHRSGFWYYLSESGAMQVGWLQHGGKQYYLHPSGQMATGTLTIDGKTYDFAQTGAILSKEAQ